MALAFSLTACSSYGKIEKALEEIGYVVIDSSAEEDKYQEDTEIPVTVHVLSNKDSLEGFDKAKTNTVIILEFKATDDLIEYYKESDTLQGFIQDVKDDGTAEEFYNELVEAGFANGNCLVFSTNFLAMSDVTTAVKNA